MKLELALNLLNISLKDYLELPNHVPLLCHNGDMVVGTENLLSFRSIYDYDSYGEIFEVRGNPSTYAELFLDFREKSNEDSVSRDGRGKSKIRGTLSVALSGTFDYIPKHYLPTDRVSRSTSLPIKALFNNLSNFNANSLEFSLIVDEILTEMGYTNMNSNNTSTTSVVSTTVSTLVDSNKASMITAAKLEVGNLAINLVTEQLLKLLPPPATMLLKDNPLLKVAVANLVQVLSTAIPVDDTRVGVVVDSMMTASYIELLNSFDLQSIVTDMLDKLPKSKLTTLTNTNT